MLFPQKINVVASARHANPHNETVVVQNDTAVEFYVAVVGDNGQTELPEGATYTLVCLHLRKEPTEKLGTLQEDGNVMFKLTHMEMSEAGTVQAQVRVYHPEGGRLTSNPFVFHVAPDPTYGAEIKPEDQSIIEQVIGEGPAIIAEAKAETELSITERTRLTGEVDGALLEMSQSKDAADQSAQVAQQAADNVSDKLNEVETARSATVDATGEARSAAQLAIDEADAARLQKVEVADILGAGPVASVNGKTGVVDGLATQESMNQVTAQLAETTEEIEMKNTFHASKAFAKLKRGEPATIVFLGDSTTEQNATTNGQPNHVGLLTTYLQNAYPSLVTVVNAGISGHSITLMLERLQKDVLAHNPDLVIVCSGINDQGGTFKITLDEFKKNYDLLIQEIISRDTTDVILRTTNVVMSAATSSAIDVYNEVTRSLAIKYDLGLFDLYKKMQMDIADGKISVLTVGPFLNDSVHPNENGHQYIYEYFKSFFIPKKAIHKPVSSRRMISAKGGFRHVGGTEFAGVSYVNGYALLFNQPNKRISFEYEGEDFTIIYGATTGTGQFKVFVDGEQQGDVVDTYSPTVKYRESVSYRVPPGKHFVEIECQPTKNANSSSTNLQIQAVIYKKENRINDNLIPLPYSYLDVRATAPITLTNDVETPFLFNSVPFNVGDIASYNHTTGEITFKKSGLYQFYLSNRFVTEPDKSLESNYKINGNTIKRAYSRTPVSNEAATPSISLDLIDIRMINAGDVLKFAMKAQGASPTTSAYAVINKIG